MRGRSSNSLDSPMDRFCSSSGRTAGLRAASIMRFSIRGRRQRLPSHSKKHIDFRLNGEHTEVAFAPHKTLLEVLREDLNLTGTKHGCELWGGGACGVVA